MRTLLATRQVTHGDYALTSQLSQRLKHDMRVALKIARIICGNAAHQDHWDDIAGYAKLGGGK